MFTLLNKSWLQNAFNVNLNFPKPLKTIVPFFSFNLMIYVGRQWIRIEVINESLKTEKNIFQGKFSEDFFFLDIAESTVEKKENRKYP